MRAVKALVAVALIAMAAHYWRGYLPLPDHRFAVVRSLAVLLPAAVLVYTAVLLFTRVIDISAIRLFRMHASGQGRVV